MGASVSNMGGGMVEILSASITNATTARITHALTNAEKTTLKTECAKYKVVLFCVEANYTYGSGTRYNVSSGVATGKSIINFLDSPATTERKVMVVNGDINSSVIQINETDGIVAGFRASNVSAANVTLKIYGLIL